jgi:hypothetical protein
MRWFGNSWDTYIRGRERERERERYGDWQSEGRRAQTLEDLEESGEGVHRFGEYGTEQGGVLMVCGMHARRFG